MTDQTRPQFPLIIDSSMLSTFRSCPRKFELEYLNHWKPKSPSIHLHAGKAYAEGLEKARKAFFVEGKPEGEAIQIGLAALITSYGQFECPPDSAKSLSRMMGAFEYYFDQYPMAADKAIPVTLPGGGKGIEFSFSEPLDIQHPVTGDPILYVGRMDMITEYAGGWFGEDDKTTSQLGASWAKQWDLRSQFTGYTWGAGKAGFPLQGFLIRGISILKTKYETQQALTYRPKWMLERWEAQTLRDIQGMIDMWKEGWFDYNLDHACAEYGGCPFRQPCLSPEPLPWLQSSFEQRVWDPVNRTEFLLNEKAV